MTEEKTEAEVVPLKVFNATRHVQRQFKSKWDEWGIVFVPTMGAQLGSLKPHATSDELMAEAHDAIEKAKFANADAVLVGGITGLAILIALLAVKNNLLVIEPQFSGKNQDSLILIGYRDITKYIVSISERK